MTLGVVKGWLTGLRGPAEGARWGDLIPRKLRSRCRVLAMKSHDVTSSLEVLLWGQRAHGRGRGRGRQGAEGGAAAVP